MSLIVTLTCLGLALLRLLRGERSLASWSFSAGMAVFAAEAVFHFLAFNALGAQAAAQWESYALVASAFTPGLWLLFSVLYARGNSGEFLRRWRSILILAFVLPAALLLLSPWPYLMVDARENVSPAVEIFRVNWLVKALHVVSLGASALTLMNLEQTFRSSVGTTRWRIKFVVLGLAMIFGAQIYADTEVILFSAQSLGLASLRLGAIEIGGLFIAMAYVRAGFAEMDVYPSQAVLRTSITVFLVGAYLLIVGVFAQLIARLGGTAGFQVQAFAVLVALAILATLLLSDRLRQNIGLFVARNFKKARHDTLRVWSRTSRDLAKTKDRRAVCAAAARVISETFQILSVSIWVVEKGASRVSLESSTIQHVAEELSEPLSPEAISALEAVAWPRALAVLEGPWSESFKALIAKVHPDVERLWYVSLRSHEELTGFAILGDRVNGVPYSLEELDLLHCMSEQCGASILNLQLTNEVIKARELEAFQAMSAFFVHDLKNTASTLTLMLRNLPTHFDDPEFRQDALRGIGSTTARINELVGRLSTFRGTLQLKVKPLDFDALVRQTVAGLQQLHDISIVEELGLDTLIQADRDQLQSVITNLLLNAREAMPTSQGQIRLSSGRLGRSAHLSVSDNGTGMTPIFIKNELFRPFRTTKKRGLGIGVFQSRMIVEAHGGRIDVESAPGKGTTFHISLPVHEQSVILPPSMN